MSVTVDGNFPNGGVQLLADFENSDFQVDEENKYTFLQLANLSDFKIVPMKNHISEFIWREDDKNGENFWILGVVITFVRSFSTVLLPLSLQNKSIKKCSK